MVRKQTAKTAVKKQVAKLVTKRRPAKVVVKMQPMRQAVRRLSPSGAHRDWALNAMNAAVERGLLQGSNCREVCERERIVDADGRVHYVLVCRIVCDD